MCRNKFWFFACRVSLPNGQKRAFFGDAKLHKNRETFRPIGQFSKARRLAFVKLRFDIVVQFFHVVWRIADGEKFLGVLAARPQ